MLFILQKLRTFVEQCVYLRGFGVGFVGGLRRRHMADFSYLRPFRAQEGGDW